MEKATRTNSTLNDRNRAWIITRHPCTNNKSLANNIIQRQRKDDGRDRRVVARLPIVRDGDVNFCAIRLGPLLSRTERRPSGVQRTFRIHARAVGSTCVCFVISRVDALYIYIYNERRVDLWRVLPGHPDNFVHCSPRD